MDRNLEVRGQWITNYFRLRWAYERTDACLADFVAAVDGLTNNEAHQIVTGYKTFVSKARGYAIEDDTATEINSLPLRWDE